jgi:hypothetical protein
MPCDTMQHCLLLLLLLLQLHGAGHFPCAIRALLPLAITGPEVYFVSGARDGKVCLHINAIHL